MSLLENRDLVLLVDQSGSMSKEDQPGGKSRWEAAQEGTLAVARKMSKLDPDGITVYAFNSAHQRFDGVKDDQKVEAIFKQDPGGGTNLVGVLTAAFDDYFTRKGNNETKANGEIWVVVTDGEPDNKEQVKKLIAANTQKMDRDEELGIQFIQIGNDGQAKAFLKELDDELVSKYGAKFDIVDTVNMDDVGARPIVEVISSAITD